MNQQNNVTYNLQYTIRKNNVTWNIRYIYKYNQYIHSNDLTGNLL